MTMVTTPKSPGVSNRARTTVAAICRTKETPWAKIVTPAPRTAARRNPWPSAMGWKSPLESKGFKLLYLGAMASYYPSRIGQRRQSVGQKRGSVTSLLSETERDAATTAKSKKNHNGSSILNPASVTL